MCILTPLFQVKKFDEDPLIYHSWIRFSWLKAMIESSLLQDEGLHKIELPVLIYHGNEDYVVPIYSSEYAYRSISSKDKILEVRFLEELLYLVCFTIMLSEK